MVTPSNWKEYLEQDFSARKAKNSAYSLRSYAKALDVSPAHLSMILSGKRKIKSKSALLLANKLGITPTETLSLLKENNHKSSSGPSKLLSDQEFSLISEWYYYAILGLASLEYNVAQPQWIAKKLGIPVNTAKQAFNDLVKMQYLAIEQGQFVQSAPRMKTSDDTPVSTIRNYHKKNLQLAAEKIDQVDVDLREYTSITLAINPKRMGAAKKMIRQFKEDFTQEMTCGKKTEVYTFSLQLFPLTHDLKKELT